MGEVGQTYMQMVTFTSIAKLLNVSIEQTLSGVCESGFTALVDHVVINATL